VQAEPLAKSLVSVVGPKAMREARVRAGYPPGGRHELMSLALLDHARNQAGLVATDWGLVLHLVASHHGRCRPFAPWISDESPVDVTFTTGDITTTVASSHTLARLDSGVAQRFWNVVRRYGWWESALLEAVLRLADQRQSAREDQRA
jgi:CRISPR-associated endonuclease/helicase Cas3